MYKIFTVDVWDTLLRRDCHPECIKLATAAYLFRFQERIVCESYKSHFEIYEIRNKIESALADKSESAGFDREYEINEVLEKWLEVVCDKNYSKELSKKLAEYEWEIEIKRSSPDPGAIDLLLSIQAEKKIFLSDFYMNSKMLGSLLNLKGFDLHLNGGVSSCDLKLNKRTGNLFKYIHSKYNINPVDHFHAGDNQWSDVDCPSVMGIKSLLYKPVKEHAEREYLESLFDSRSILFAEMISKINALEPHGECLDSPEKIECFKLGLSMAPLFVGFVFHVIERAIADNVDKICYLTREGEFFKKIHDHLYSGGSKYFGHQVPSSELLEVSRLSTFLPSLKNISSEEFARMWRIHGQQSIEGFFISLGFRVENFEALLNSHKIDINEVIVTPEADSRFIALIGSEEFISIIESRLLDQKILLQKYFLKKNIVQGMRVGLVDVGWRGSIQDNLANIFDLNNFYGYYLGLKKFVERQSSNVIKNAWLIDESENFDLTKAKCLEAFAVIEMLCNSDSGSVVDYGLVDGIVIANKSIDVKESAAYNDFTKYFQDGIIAAAQMINEHMDRYVVAPSEMQDIALKIWHVAGSNPPDKLVDIFMNSTQHDIFSLGDIFDRSDIPSLPLIFKSFFIKDDRKKLIKFIGRVQWTAAIKKMDGIGFFHRNILTLLFNLANFYRVCKIRYKNFDMIN
jgi:FMN phosphatase YigB (HAD superfamily)